MLAVDDNAINRQILAEQLRKLNCTVILAADGQHALSLLRRQEVDLILTDINMPVMDGYALARHVREQGHAMPIYGVTAMALTTEHHQADAAGMTGLLPRPLSIASLSDLLQRNGMCVPT